MSGPTYPPPQQRSGEDSITIGEVGREVGRLTDSVKQLTDTVGKLPDRLDERYVRKEVHELTTAALTARLEAADENARTARNFRYGLGTAVVVEALAIAGAFLLPH